jgi:hypothetical protein
MTFDPGDVTFDECLTQFFYQLEAMNMQLLELRALHDKEMAELREKCEAEIFELQRFGRERGLDKAIEQFYRQERKSGTAGSK